MRYLNLLIPKEKIIGIEIGSQKLRMLYLELNGKNEAIVKGKSETELEDNIIAHGIVKNKKKLSEAIAKLKENFEPKKLLSPFAVVTIPQSNVYSEIFEFPKSLSDEQLIESININATENLPLPLSECYMDWQIIKNDETKNKKRVLVSLIPKVIANDYTYALKENGFQIIALETTSLSIERATDISEDPTVFLYIADEGLTSIVYYKRFPYLTRTELWKEATNGKEIRNTNDLNMVIKNKIKILATYFESKYSPLKIKRALLMSYGYDTNIIMQKIGAVGLSVEKAQTKIGAIENTDLVPVAGAAARAFIPRSDDTIISLLPVGTESLYEKQKAVSFASSIVALFFAVSMLYIAIFAITYFLVSSIASNVDKQLNTRNNTFVSEENTKIELETKEFNSYVKDIENIFQKTDIGYELILKDIVDMNTPGITITNISLNGSLKSISISGVASARENLNVFRSKMESSTDFKDIKFSIPNIAQKNNISFTVTLFHT